MHTTTPKSLGMDLPNVIVMDAEQGGKTFTMHTECWDRVRAYWVNAGDPWRMSEYGPCGPIAPGECAYKNCQHATERATEQEATMHTTEEPEIMHTTEQEATMHTTDTAHAITVTDARKLATVLAYTKRAGGVTVGSARVNPFMGTITVTATARTLTITHTSYETTTETHLEATGDSTGWDAEWSADVPLAALTDAAKAAGAGSLTITRTPDGQALTVASSGQESTITTIRPNDKAAAIPAPDLTATDADHQDQEDERTAENLRRNAQGEEYIEKVTQKAAERRDKLRTTGPRTTQNAPVILDGPTMASTITHGAAGAGNDDTLPVLTGAKIEVEQGGAITMASTDRFRLAVAEATPAARANETSALAPARWLTDTAKMMAKDDAVALSISRATRTDGTISAGDFWLTLAGDTTTSSARLIDAEFPKFRQLMREDADTDTRSTTDAAALVKLVKPWAKDSFVDLIVDPDGTVTAERRPRLAIDGPPMARATVGAGDVHAADAVRIRLDARYLASLLAAAPRGSKATLRIVSPARPIMISHPGGTGLLMPVRIGN